MRVPHAHPDNGMEVIALACVLHLHPAVNSAIQSAFCSTCYVQNVECSVGHLKRPGSCRHLIREPVDFIVPMSAKPKEAPPYLALVVQEKAV